MTMLGSGVGVGLGLGIGDGVGTGTNGLAAGKLCLGVGETGTGLTGLAISVELGDGESGRTVIGGCGWTELIAKATPTRTRFTTPRATTSRARWAGDRRIADLLLPARHDQ